MALTEAESSELYLPNSLGLTSECTDLLRQLLHADPHQRIDIAGILADPWFRKGLPPGVLDMNAQFLSSTGTSCFQSQEGEGIGRRTYCSCAPPAGGLVLCRIHPDDRMHRLLLDVQMLPALVMISFCFSGTWSTDC